MKLKRKSGETACARLDCILRMDAADRALAILVALTDVTERQKMEAELQKGHDQLEQQVEKRTAELREALSEIQTYSSAYKGATKC